MSVKRIEKSQKFGYSVVLEEDESGNKYKAFLSDNANYIFDLQTGDMMTWGSRPSEDAERFPAPNILDLEISTICNKKCQFCYKSNNPNGELMSFETFKKIIDVIPKSITQVAIGADYSMTSNPDIENMFSYLRKNNIVPNITVGYLDDAHADIVSKYCGACAVSVYEPKDACYDTVERLTERGMKQVNLHFMLAEETYDKCLEVLDDIKNDPRLEGVRALVILSLKKKGRGIGYHPVSQEQFSTIVKKAGEIGISLGFDSCSSLKAYRALDPEVRRYIIPCEASTESSYIDVHGNYYPCSFMEGFKDDKLDWSKGINVLECKSTDEFIEKVWNNPKTLLFRDILMSTCKDNCENCKHCPAYEV